MRTQLPENAEVATQFMPKTVKGYNDELEAIPHDVEEAKKLLKEAGYDYVMDWPADDQPFWMRTRSGPILSVPYSIELNDSPALVFRQQAARDFEDMIVDQFDEMLLQSAKWPLVFTVVLAAVALVPGLLLMRQEPSRIV